MEATNARVPHRPRMHVLIAELPARTSALVMAHHELPYFTPQRLSMEGQAVLKCRQTFKRVGIVERPPRLQELVMAPVALRFTLPAMP